MINLHIFPKSAVASQAGRFTIKQLSDYLKVGQTLLVVSGGSIAREVLPILLEGFPSIEKIDKLTVVLADERYGFPFHKDSNMLLLREIGFLDKLNQLKATVEMPLNTTKVDLNSAAQNYHQTIQELFNLCQSRTLGLFGIGTDGHTAGIKPDQIIPTDKYVVGYRADDFVRITLTPKALKQIKTAVIYAVGRDKKDVLHKLLKQPSQTLLKFPASIWQEHPNCHLFTDQIID